MNWTALKSMAVIITAVLYLNLCQAQPAGNIVQNWNFSSPNGLSFPGWTYSGFMWSAYSGVNGGPCVGINSYFAQTLATQPGQTYLLQFYTTTEVSGISQSGPYGLSVTWDSQNPVSYTFTEQSVDWFAEELWVTASSDQTTLTFDRIYGALPYLTDVSVVPASEPAGVVLFFAGIGFLGLWRMLSISVPARRAH